MNTSPSFPIQPILTIQPTNTASSTLTPHNAPPRAEYTYSIDGTTFQASPTFNGLAAKLYTITVRSSVAGSCEATATEELKAATGGPTVTKTSVQPTCATPTGSITVTAPLGAEYSYSIDGTTFQASPIFNGLAPKLYTITVRSSVAGSCEATATEEIKAASGGPTVTKTSVQPTCAVTTGSITVTAPLGAEIGSASCRDSVQGSPVFNGMSQKVYNIAERSSESSSGE